MVNSLNEVRKDIKEDKTTLKCGNDTVDISGSKIDVKEKFVSACRERGR